QLAINDSGTAVVIWTRITSTGFLHNVRICTASGCANPLTSISSTSTSLCTSAGECTAASIDRSGNAFVLYPLEIMDGGPSGANWLGGRRYVPGIGWGTSLVVDGYFGNGEMFGYQNPQIRCDSFGNAVAVWGEGGALWRNGFSNSGQGAWLGQTI